MTRPTMRGWVGLAKMVDLKGEREMKVRELIAALKDVPQDLDVFVWDECDRMLITDVNDASIDRGFVDINTSIYAIMNGNKGESK